MKQYRAWYTEDDPLKLFEMVYIPNDKLYFRMVEDHEIIYQFYFPFIDTDWIVEEEILLLDNSEPKKPIFVGDILDSTMFKDDSPRPYEVIYSDGSYRKKPLSCEWPEGLPYPKLDQAIIDLLTDKIIGNIHEKEKKIEKNDCA